MGAILQHSATKIPLMRIVLKGMTSFLKVFLALFKVYVKVGKSKLGSKLFTPKLIQLLHLLSVACFGTSLKMFWKEEIYGDGGRGYD